MMTPAYLVQISAKISFGRTHVRFGVVQIIRTGGDFAPWILRQNRQEYFLR